MQYYIIPAGMLFDFCFLSLFLFIKHNIMNNNII